MTNTNLFLIRHGEAVVNVKPIVGGMRGDTGLTEHGIKQAESLRDRLAATEEITADVLISSTLPRARQTAEIIAPALGLPIIFDSEFMEMRVGDADGMSNRDAWAKFGVPIVDEDPFHQIAPNGENWGQFMLRVATAYNRITKEYAGKTLVIVCHGGVIDGSFIYFFGMSSLTPPITGLYTHNTSITHWRHYRTKEDQMRWRLMKYNDTFHLRYVGIREPINWKDTSPVPDVGPDHTAVPLPTEEHNDE
jgi:probable phosphoglycerate mutase